MLNLPQLHALLFDLSVRREKEIDNMKLNENGICWVWNLKKGKWRECSRVFSFVARNYDNKNFLQLKLCVFIFAYFLLKSNSHWPNHKASTQFEEGEKRRKKDYNHKTNKSLNFNFHILPFNDLQFVCFCICWYHCHFKIA